MARMHHRGVSAIEVIIGVSIAAMVLTFTMFTVSQFINAGRTIGNQTQALYLAEEGLELLRFIHDENWSDIGSLPENTTRYLEVTPTDISVDTTPEVIDGYTRSFVVSNVYRSATTDDIIASTTSGAVADSSSRYVTVTVTGGAPSIAVSLVTILADITQ